MHRWLKLAIGFASITSLILLWEYYYRSGLANSQFFPPPSELYTTLVKSDFKVGLGSQAQSIEVSIASTFYRVFAGMLIGLLASIIVGAVIASNRFVSAAVTPIIRSFAPIAPIAWIPLALILFGIGNQTAIFIVFMGVFFTLTISMVNAVSNVPNSRIEMIEGLGASKRAVWQYVVIPSVLPQVFLSLRLNFIAAWMAVLAAEMTGLQDGIGAILMIGRNLFNSHLILLGMVLIGLFGAIIDFLLSSIQRKFLWWENS